MALTGWLSWCYAMLLWHVACGLTMHGHSPQHIGCGKMGWVTRLLALPVQVDDEENGSEADADEMELREAAAGAASQAGGMAAGTGSMTAKPKSVRMSVGGGEPWSK